MDNLFKHIEYLLLRNECVIVPGFGAFISTVIPARIDVMKAEIIPPSKSVMFNQSVTVDDGLLANSYARKSGIKFEEARQVIAKDVNSVKSLLLGKGEASCGNLGKLAVGEEGNLVFIPRFDTGMISEMSGFCRAAMLSEPECYAAPISHEASYCNPSPNSDSVKKGKPYYSLRINKTFIRVASVVALVFAVALTVILNPIPHDNREQRASVVPVEVLIAHPKQETTPVDTLPAQVETLEPEKKQLPAHYLIVATFSSEKEALAYAEKYSTVEFPMIPVSSRKMCRVAIASSDDRDSLRLQLNSAPVSSRYPGAWIWTRN